MLELVERRDAIPALQDLMKRAVDGRGRVVTVAGGVGAGKTELLTTIADRAVELGAQPVVASGSRAEQELPFGVLSQLFHDAGLDDELREPAMALLDRETRAALQAGGAGAVDPWSMQELCNVLLRLSERKPLAVLVDDVHHADPASAACLDYLARRARFAPLLAVYSYSDAEPQNDLIRIPYGVRLRLTALSPEGALEMAAAAAGVEAAEQLGDTWHALSGGNLLLLSGLLEDHASTVAVDGRPVDEAPVGAGYGRAVLECLQRGEPPTLEVARGLAVLPDPEAVAGLLDISPSAVSRVVQALTFAGVLTEGRFRHDAAREAVLADVDANDLAELHRRAAALAYDRGAAPEVVADHLVGSGGVGEPWSVPVLEDAARQALRDGRVEVAIVYLKLAHQECTDETQRNTILTTLLQAEWRINPAMPNRLATELLARMRRGALRGRDTLTLAKALLWQGDFEHAREAFAALRVPAQDSEPDTTIALAIGRPWVRCTYPTFRDAVPKLPIRPSLAASTVVETRRLNAVTVLAGVLERGPGNDIVATLDRILRGTRLDEMTLDTVESSLLALVYADHAEQAAPWCDQFREEAGQRGAPSRLARMTALRAEIALRLGDLQGAADEARNALTIIPPGSWGVAVGGPLATLITALSTMGQLDEVREWLDVPVPDAMFDTRAGLSYLQARGRHSAAIGHPRLALRDFRRCADQMTAWNMDAPGLVPWRLEAAEVKLMLGETEAARTLVEEQFTSCAKLPRVRGIAMRLLAAMSPLRHRPMLLRQSGDLLQSCGDRYELTLTLSALTNSYAILGESRRAGMIRRQVQALAQECRAPLDTRDAPSDEVPATGEVPAAPTGPAALLSDAERRVAALAAVGYSNREIAEKLFVTLSTVEQHLTRVYRKLQVSSRAELPASFEGGRPQDRTEVAA